MAPEKDPVGAAIRDYCSTGKAGRLRVFSSQFDEDGIPVAGLFRTYPEMPALEQKALQLAGGLILDVGAGSGCHTLALKEMGKDALPADISPLAVEVMRARGLDARLVNLFDPRLAGQFDTVHMMMNGSGVIARLEKIGALFRRMTPVLTPEQSVMI